MLTKQQVLSKISDCGVVAVIRAPSMDVLPDITRALLDGGVVSIEVTMSTPNAIEGISALSETFAGGEAIVGVGTVLDAQTAKDAIAAGAMFVVAPTFNADVVNTTKAAGRVMIPGAFTPNEILKAHSAGADVVKVFPSTALGPGYFKDILAPMPFLRLTPTGGVDASNAGAWIKAGAVCVGAGSSLVSKEAMQNKDWASITKNAKAFVEAVKAARAK